ncbi:MAG: hypothetical protein HOW73_32845 [Polyangiaceae bacterium]|nr:hypothetical protein [Polyangiaceae bacterium]
MRLTSLFFCLACGCTFPDLTFDDTPGGGGGSSAGGNAPTSTSTSTSTTGGEGGIAGGPSNGGGGNGGQGGSTPCDHDGDGYPRDEVGCVEAGGSGGAGGSGQLVDCNDDNGDVHPEQPDDWYVEPIPGETDPVRKWDYDCSEDAETQYVAGTCPCQNNIKRLENVPEGVEGCGQMGSRYRCNIDLVANCEEFETDVLQGCH